MGANLAPGVRPKIAQNAIEAVGESWVRFRAGASVEGDDYRPPVLSLHGRAAVSSTVRGIVAFFLLWPRRTRVAALAILFGAIFFADPLHARSPDCDRACLDAIGGQYMDAYRSRDPARAPFARSVRYSENNVVMPFPDGTWDTIDREVGPSFAASDPQTGEVGIFTSIMQHDVPGFLAVRLKVRSRRIAEVEQFIATQRNLSLAKLGDVAAFAHDPDIGHAVGSGDRASRADLAAAAYGYFTAMEKNDGRLAGIRFAPGVKRLSNGVTFADVGELLESGFFRFNDRVRDRHIFVIDEARGIVLASLIIDHKGSLDTYRLADGRDVRSPYREPHSLMGIELFKLKAGVVTAMETIYVQLPYNMQSAWRRTRRGDRQGK